MPKNPIINITKDANSIPLWGRDFALDEYCTNMTLAADSEQTVDVPDACNVAIITYASAPSVFVSLETFTPAAADDQNNQAAIINAVSLHVRPGETLHFLSLTDNYASVSFYYNQDGQLGG